MGREEDITDIVQCMIHSWVAIGARSPSSSLSTAKDIHSSSISKQGDGEMGDDKRPFERSVLSISQNSGR